MTSPDKNTDTATMKSSKPNGLGHWIGVSLLLGVLCGLLFGERCASLQWVGQAYVVQQLETGQIDIAVGGLMILPERLLRVAFTQPYDTATMAVILPDYRRDAFANWFEPDRQVSARYGAIHEDVAVAARRSLPGIEIVTIESLRSFFTPPGDDLDGIIMPAEQGATWTVLYPEYAVVVPKPVIRRPVGMAVRAHEMDWVNLLDRWLDFEKLNDSLARLRAYWVEGSGTQQRLPRWCVLHDVLHWLP